MNLAPQLAALEPALEHGGRLFPCAERAKVPLLTDWPRRASSNAEVISRWAEKYVNCNWALATGPESGVFVLDVDGERGENSLRSLVEQHGTWEKTLTASTKRGTHFYFRWPDAETVIRNSANKIGAGLDVRGRRGYVIVPPSVHPSGTRYEWTADSQAIAAPGWLLETITSATTRPVLSPSEFGILPEGQRNDGLMRLAGALRRKGKSQSEIEAKLFEANTRRCNPPLPESEVQKIAASVGRYAPGGDDPLECAWRATAGDYSSNYERFLALSLRLQADRPGQPIALPLERIAELMGAHWTSVSRYRVKAVTTGLLDPAGEYIAHRRAGLYRCSEMLTKNQLLTSGLVSIPCSEQGVSPLVSTPEITPSEHQEISPSEHLGSREKYPLVSIPHGFAEKVALSKKNAQRWDEIAGGLRQ